MCILIILLLCILATSKVTLQSRFGRKNLSTKSDNIIFNAIVFLTAAILFSPSISNTSLGTWIFAAVFGLFTVIFQLSYTNALSLGNVSLTVMVVNLSMLFPVLASVILYHEHITPLRVIGILLIISSFILCVDINAKEKLSPLWLFSTLVATFANGGIGIVQKIFGASIFHDEKKAFVSCSYTISFMITFLFFVVTHIRQKNSTAYKKATTYLFAISAGIILAVFQWLNTYAISIIDGSFLFPIYSGGSIILSTLVGVLFFKDKLTHKQKISILLGIVSVVIMNL